MPRRSRTSVAIDDPSTRTTTIAVAVERFSVNCPNFLWWWGSLFCSPSGGAESPMAIFELANYREVRLPFIRMPNARICSTACALEPLVHMCRMQREPDSNALAARTALAASYE